MKLSELKKIGQFDFQIIRDAEFNQLGMATSTFETYGVLSFLGDEKYTNDILNHKDISAVLTTEDIYQSRLKSNDSLGILLTANPKQMYYQIHNYLASINFYWKPFENSIDSSSIISKTAILSNHSVKIGKNCLIEDHVIINSGVTLGDHVIIRSGTILGSNGFQFLTHNEEVMSVDSAGQVIIGNHVEVQHNCCIDRGVLGGSTILKDYVKIDNFVHIAHDCVIGERTMITAGVKFGGRTKVGKDSWLGINSTISNGLVIGDNVTISLGSVVTRNVESGATVSGNFAIDHAKFIQFIKSIR